MSACQLSSCWRNGALFVKVATNISLDVLVSSEQTEPHSFKGGSSQDEDEGLNPDIEWRDTIIFGKYDPKAYRGGLRQIESISLEQLKILAEEGFLNPKDSQNGAPSIAKMMRFMSEHEGFVAHGYAISKDRYDYRVSLEGLKKLGETTDKEKDDFAEFFHGADALSVKSNILYCWYD